MVLAIAAGCGRLGFDTSAVSPDGAPDARTQAAFGNGCVVGFHFEEPAWAGAPGEVIDACGGDQPGKAAGGARPVDDPVRGRVADFSDTIADCIVIGDEPALRLAGAITMSAWVFPTGLDAVNPYGIIAKRTDDLAEVAYTMFVWTDNHVFVDLDTENDELASTGTLANGRWQQITTVYDGSQPVAARVKIYIDGVLDREAPESASAITPFTSALHVGCLPQQAANKQSFHGRLDDVGVWDRAFTAAEVRGWYEASKL
jgi:hypothetical protein